MTAFGRPHIHLPLTESTNDVARELAEEGSPSGTVVTASEQSAGRGRRGRVWSAPAGKALLYSAILIFPLFRGFWLSLNRVDEFGGGEFVGFATYVRMANDPVFEERG